MKGRNGKGMVGIIVILLFVILIFLLIKPSKQAEQPTSSTDTSQEQKSIDSPEKVDTEKISYQVETEEDVSYADVKRMTFRVIIDPAATDDELLQVFKEIDKNKYDNVTIWFYKDKSELDDPYTVAMLERAEKGGEVTITK